MCFACTATSFDAHKLLQRHAIQRLAIRGVPIQELTRIEQDIEAGFKVAPFQHPISDPLRLLTWIGECGVFRKYGPLLFLRQPGND